MADIDILTNYSIKDLAGPPMGTMRDGLELTTLHFPSIARANGSSGDKLGSLPVIFGLNPSFFSICFSSKQEPADCLMEVNVLCCW